jgi:hypothetical protein
MIVILFADFKHDVFRFDPLAVHCILIDACLFFGLRRILDDTLDHSQWIYQTFWDLQVEIVA